jgi:hypothetical protein
MEHDDESALHEKPLEFLTSIGNTGGTCDGQAILPDGDHYRSFCSCGEWAIETDTQEDGLHAARVHTGSVPA